MSAATQPGPVVALVNLGVTRWLAPVVAAVLAAISIPALSAAVPPTTTSYAAISPVALTVTVVVALALLAAGTYARSSRTTSVLGVVLLVMSAAWLAPVWVGWPHGPSLVRSLGMLLAPLSVPALVHLALAGPGGRFLSPVSRWAGIATWSAAAAFSILRATVRDPFLDPHCWSNCSDNVFLIHAAPGFGRWLDTIWDWFVVAAGAAACAVVATRIVRGRLRTWLWQLPAAAAFAALADVGFAIARLGDPPESASIGLFRDGYYVRAAALTITSLAAALSVLKARRLASAVAQLATDLGSTRAPGGLQSWLAQALDDPTLRVAYWRDESSTYIDAKGRPVSLSPDDLLATVPITRAGRPVAVVIHQRGRARADDVRDHLGPAARLAIDNERLRAAMLAHLTDLRESRARIVESADAARRRLERDLHDGAQQRLLAVVYQLRAARAAAPSDSLALDELAAAALMVAAELRDLAHGIFPAILEEAGLEPALQSLADLARVPTQITVTGESPSTAVARAVYALVATCIPDEGERPVRIRAWRLAELFVADIDGAAEVDYTHCYDRIGALGGNIVADGRHLRAEVPCE